MSKKSIPLQHEPKGSYVYELCTMYRDTLIEKGNFVTLQQKRK